MQLRAGVRRALYDQVMSKVTVYVFRPSFDKLVFDVDTPNTRADGDAIVLLNGNALVAAFPLSNVARVVVEDFVSSG